MSLRTSRNPFPGPQPYLNNENFLFSSARGKLANKLTNAVEANAVTILYGPSGAGKTSLLNAIVIPELSKIYNCILKREWQHLPSSANEIYTSRLSENKQNLLILDQLELLLPPHHPEDRSFKLIREFCYLALKSESLPRIVFGIREDYLGVLLDVIHNENISTDHSARIPMMRLNEMVDIACMLWPDWYGEPSLGMQLREVCIGVPKSEDKNPEINATLAQIIFHERVENKRLVDEGTTASKIIESYLNNAFDGANDNKTTDAKEILFKTLDDCFIDSTGRRKFVKDTDLSSGFFNLDKLVNIGIISKYEEQGKFLYALSHDAIIETIKNSLRSIENTKLAQDISYTTRLVIEKFQSDFAKSQHSLIIEFYEKTLTNLRQIHQQESLAREQAHQQALAESQMAAAEERQRLDARHTLRLNELRSQYEAKLQVDASARDKAVQDITESYRQERERLGAARQAQEREHQLALTESKLAADANFAEFQRLAAEERQRLDARHTLRLNELCSQYEAKLQSDAEAHAESERDLTDRYRQERERLEAERQAEGRAHQLAIAEFKKAADAQLAELQKMAAEERQSLDARHTSRLNELRSQYEAKLQSDAKARAESELDITERYRQERERLGLEHLRALSQAQEEAAAERKRLLESAEAQRLQIQTNYENRIQQLGLLHVTDLNRVKAEHEAIVLSLKERQTAALDLSDQTHRELMLAQFKQSEQISTEQAAKAATELANLVTIHKEDSQQKALAHVRQRKPPVIAAASLACTLGVGSLIGGLTIRAQRQDLEQQQLAHDNVQHQLEITDGLLFTTIRENKQDHVLTVSEYEFAQQQPNKAASVLLELEDVEKYPLIEQRWRAAADKIIAKGLRFRSELQGSISEIKFTDDGKGISVVTSEQSGAPGSILSKRTQQKDRQLYLLRADGAGGPKVGPFGPLTANIFPHEWAFSLLWPSEKLPIAPARLMNRLEGEKGNLPGCRARATRALNLSAACRPQDLKYAYAKDPSGIQSPTLIIACEPGIRFFPYVCSPDNNLSNPIELDPDANYQAVQPSPDGRFVAARSFLNKLVVFDLHPGVGVSPRKLPIDLGPDAGLTVYGLRWSGERDTPGQAAVSAYNVLQLWDFAAWEPGILGKTAQIPLLPLQEVRKKVARFATVCLSIKERSSLLRENLDTAYNRSHECEVRLHQMNLYGQY